MKICLRERSSTGRNSPITRKCCLGKASRRAGAMTCRYVPGLRSLADSVCEPASASLHAPEHDSDECAARQYVEKCGPRPRVSVCRLRFLRNAVMLCRLPLQDPTHILWKTDRSECARLVCSNRIIHHCRSVSSMADFQYSDTILPKANKSDI